MPNDNKPEKPKTAMPKFDVDDVLVRKLSSLLNETGLAELEYADGEKRIRLTRGGSATQHVAVHTNPMPVPMAAPAAAKAEGTVSSPMVGTVYLAPQPGAKPFVVMGAKIKQGDTIAIIEAMKVMNPIKAPKGGTVAEIMVQDAQPVEFGQPLVVIE